MDKIQEATNKLQKSSAITLLGIIALGYLSYIVSNILLQFAQPGEPITNLKKGSDKVWAVVTGASDGIGAEFVHQIASKGYNVLLVSRTQSKLDQLASDIRSKYHVETKTFAIDASSVSNHREYEALAQLIEDMDIAILVNNVGQSHDIPVPFHLTDVTEMIDIVNINVISTLRITRLVLPRLLLRRSLILTMGSFGGFLPTPLLATYSGSKAFLHTWSIALASELELSKVTVKLVNSYLVTSKMSKIRKATLSVPTPKAFVKATLGGIKGGPVITPYWVHGIMAWVLDLMGRESYYVVKGNKEMHMSIRGRALKKRGLIKTE